MAFGDRGGSIAGLISCRQKRHPKGFKANPITLFKCIPGYGFARCLVPVFLRAANYKLETHCCVETKVVNGSINGRTLSLRCLVHQ